MFHILFLKVTEYAFENKVAELEQVIDTVETTQVASFQRFFHTEVTEDR